MELFLPIKVTKGDKLPQKVCDRCSFILNDIYQFCNIAIETQVRLRSMLLHVGINLSDSIDLSIPKREEQLPKISSLTRTEQGTQTDDISCKEIGSEQVKEEPKSPLPTSPFPIKRESSVESDHYDPSSVFSDSSEDMSLIALKRKKRGRKQKINLEHKVDEKDCQEGDRGKSNNSTPMTRRRKKVNNHNVTVHEKLPNDIAVDLIRKSKDSLKNKIKSESVLNKCDNDTSQSSVVVKKEPTVEDTYQCCICFAKCYSRSDILQHYR
ncbi:unnamed protein product [Diatraea saccharalis]|uniref:ZAD domain-containing protein n=1 Tax=Diatraea saccharalis TaxID=40085 RepID=A0A9N9RG83_9NEOP|nr:unnamed protein product [Diatraea saccharalis]